MSNKSVGNVIRRGISDVLLILAVAFFAAAAGLWMHSRDTYAVVEKAVEQMQEFAKPSPKPDEPPTVDWDALKSANSQVVGWISIPNTSVNYPVVQAENNEYYLRRDLYRNYSEGGTIFLDCDSTAPGLVDPQSILYGHHMKNGVMFKQVADFDKQEFFDSVSRLWYLTPERTYELVPMFLMYTQGENVALRQFSFNNDAEYRRYLKTALGDAVTRMADVDKAVAGVSHTVALCTCNYIEGKGRSVLFCAEKSEVEAALRGEVHALPDKAAESVADGSGVIEGSIVPEGETVEEVYVEGEPSAETETEAEVAPAPEPAPEENANPQNPETTQNEAA